MRYEETNDAGTWKTEQWHSARGADDKCNICPVRSWVQQHRTLLIVCFGVLGVLLLLMLGSRKTVLNIANQPRRLAATRRR